MAPTAVRKLAARTIAALGRELAAIERTMKALIQEQLPLRCARARGWARSSSRLYWPCSRSYENARRDSLMAYDVISIERH